MKKFKKLISVMLTVVMAMAMSITAFATEPDDSDASVTHTYEIYQIFTGDYAKKGDEVILSNVKWGQNGTTKEGKVSQDILEELQALTNTASDSIKLETITKYADLGSTPFESGTAMEYNVPSGYYLVKDADNSLNDTNEAYTLYVVQVVNDKLTITPKGDVPKLEKNILEDGAKVDTNNTSIGEIVHYQIKGTVSDKIADYKYYYYAFTDKLSKGLTYQNDVTVTVDGTDVTDKFFKGTETDADGNTIITISVQDLKEVARLTADSEVIVTYSAMLNENAVIAGPNPNTVILEYANDPNNTEKGEPDENGKPDPKHPTGKTPEEKVETYTTELAILKIKQDGADDNSKDILEGAEFTLTSSGEKKVGLVAKEEFVSAEDGKYYQLKNGSYTTMLPVSAGGENADEDYNLEAGMFNLVKTFTTKAEAAASNATAVIDADGRITFTGLGEGTYTIEETKVPDGYNKAENIVFTVTFNVTEKTFTADKVSLGANNTLETTIINRKGTLLPSTGGIGTTIFYIVGAILVIGAGIILVAKKRMAHE